MLHCVSACCLSNCCSEHISSLSSGSEGAHIGFAFTLDCVLLVHFASSDVTDPSRSKVAVLAMERGRDGSQQRGHHPPVVFWKFMGLFLVSIMNWGKVAFTGWGHGCWMFYMFK